MTDSLGVENYARRVSAFGLPGGGGEPPLPPIGNDEWSPVLASLDSSRITGFAVAGAEAGWLDLSAGQSEELLAAHRRAMLSPLAVERGLVEISEEFQSAAVDFVVLKGPALAHTVYPDPAWRFFGDLDLLVRGSDWRKAAAILEALGYHRNLPEPRPGFDERFGKATEFRKTGGIEVDLHRTLVVGPFGLWIEPEELFDATTELHLWDRALKRLDDTMLQLHACIHASLGWWPPLTVPVRDVAQVAHYGRVDWGALADRAARWKLRAVVRHAFETASQILNVDLPSGAQSFLTTKAGRRERRLLDAYVSDRRSRGGTALSAIRAIPGLRAKAAYVRALVLPDRSFLAARTGSPSGSYLRRWAVPLRWILGRRRRA